MWCWLVGAVETETWPACEAIGARPERGHWRAVLLSRESSSIGRKCWRAPSALRHLLGGPWRPRWVVI